MIKGSVCVQGIRLAIWRVLEANLGHRIECSDLVLLDNYLVSKHLWRGLLLSAISPLLGAKRGVGECNKKEDTTVLVFRELNI